MQLEQICFLLKIPHGRCDGVLLTGGSLSSSCQEQDYKAFEGVCFAWHDSVHRNKCLGAKNSMLALHSDDLPSNCLNLASRSVSWPRAFFIFLDLLGSRISIHLWSREMSSSLASILGKNRSITIRFATAPVCEKIEARSTAVHGKKKYCLLTAAPAQRQE